MRIRKMIRYGITCSGVTGKNSLRKPGNQEEKLTFLLFSFLLFSSLLSFSWLPQRPFLERYGGILCTASELR